MSANEEGILILFSYLLSKWSTELTKIGQKSEYQKRKVLLLKRILVFDVNTN